MEFVLSNPYLRCVFVVYVYLRFMLLHKNIKVLDINRFVIRASVGLLDRHHSNKALKILHVDLYFLKYCKFNVKTGVLDSKIKHILLKLMRNAS